jgi:glycerol-3-phosphate acyltransferase PlsX
LSIGEESTKGNDLTLTTYKLLSEDSSLNFIGNVEGRDVLKGTCDVVVCDGFVGNIVLKFAESIDGFLTWLVKKRVKESFLFRLGAFLVKVSIRDLRKVLDYTEYGGAPLLGVNGVCIICHGESPPKAIKNALKLAADMVREKVNEHITKILRDKEKTNQKNQRS